MYESITYEELKSLPRDQKIEALKELRALYPTQKKIAEKLGVNPANIYNMIAKYIKADDEGQPKAKVNVVREAARPAEVKAEVKSEVKSEAKSEANTEAKSLTFEPERSRVKHVRDKRRNMQENLQFTVAKSLTGEEAQYLFTGIGSTFLKNHDYRVEIRIIEK